MTFDEHDARDADLANGTVFFLYAPFTGEVLDAVLLRLRAVAETHAIVVVALGVDLGRASAWLVARPLDAFWLAIYDSALSASASRQRPRPRTGATLGVRLAGTDAEVIAFGRERAG